MKIGAGRFFASFDIVVVAAVVEAILSKSVIAQCKR